MPSCCVWFIANKSFPSLLNLVDLIRASVALCKHGNCSSMRFGEYQHPVMVVFLVTFFQRLLLNFVKETKDPSWVLHIYCVQCKTFPKFRTSLTPLLTQTWQVTH